MGALPYPGTLDDQPYHVFQAFALCERVMSDVQAKESKQQETNLEKMLENVRNKGK